jgi:hypothetical protein
MTPPQPLLKFHNPRTFEDLNNPVPNFRAQNLKPGEVGKFFDNVLQKRAGDAVDTVSVGGVYGRRACQAPGVGRRGARTCPCRPVQTACALPPSHID